MADHAVSVVIPTYNRAKLIGRAIKSVLANVSADDEILVIDDGSQDETAAVVAKFGPRVRFLRVPHGGAGRARNHGIRESRNPLVAFLDSDDEWLPNKLLLQRALMQRRPELVYCFSEFEFKYEEGHVAHNHLKYWHNDPRPWSEILAPGAAYSSLAGLPEGITDFNVYIGDMYLPTMLRSYVFTSTVIVRKQAAGVEFRFAEDIPTYEDRECFGRISRMGPAAFMNCETARQRGHGGPRLTDANTVACARAELTIVLRVWGSNEAFMVRHANPYRQHVDNCRRVIARGLILDGQIEGARQMLAQMSHPPLTYQVLTALGVRSANLVVGRYRQLRRLQRSVAGRLFK